MAIDVTLTIIETQHAAMVGAMRHIEATKRRLANRFGADPDNGWTLNIEGAAGELAVAKVLNRYWEMPINTFRQGGDVGSLQVRQGLSTNSPKPIRPSLNTVILLSPR